MVSSIAVRSTAIPESIIRKELWQSLLALHHLHTAIEDRPGVVHRALGPEKRESKQEARGVDVERQTSSILTFSRGPIV
jgi:hypothetical protein